MGTDARLLLLSTLVATLTAEAHPAGARVMPSPLFNHRRPTAFFYSHRKLSRPWLVKMQEELWKDGPSGDGPGEDAWSTLLPSTGSWGAGYVSETLYKTYSPSAGDFLSETEPFPTIIDTMVDESPSYGEEFITRTSVSYEGPSSLLNSLIFRPSLPRASLSSTRTPSLEASKMDPNDAFPMVPSDESSAVWKISPRQAVSETMSDHYFIITAISATHIFRDVGLTPSSITVSVRSEIFSGFSTEEELLTTKTANHFEVPSSSSSSGVHQNLLGSVKENQFSILSKTLNLSSPLFDYGYSIIEDLHPTLASPIFSDSTNLSADPFKTDFNSDSLNGVIDMPYISSSHKLFEETPFLDLSVPTNLSEYVIAASTASNADQTHKMSDSFSTDIHVFYNFNTTFYTETSSTSFLSSNILATVTIVQNDQNTEGFIMPTLTVHGTSAITDIYLIDIFDTISVNISEKVEFPHISSSFSDFSDAIPIISLWPLDDVSSVENIISREETKTYLKEISHSSESHSAELSLEVPPQIFTSTRTHHPLENEISGGKYSSPEDVIDMRSKSSNNDIEYSIRSNLPNYDRTRIPTGDQTSTFLRTESSPTGDESWMNETETIQSADEGNPTPFGRLKSSHVIKSSTLLISISDATTSSTVYKESYTGSLLTTGPLTVNTHSSQQEMTPTTVSAAEIKSATDNRTRNEKEILQTHVLGDSGVDFIDPTTHHVTVRSLKDDSSGGMDEWMPLNYVTTSSRDGVQQLTSSHTLLPELTRSDDNGYSPLGRTASPYDVHTKEFSPISIESSFQEYTDGKEILKSSSIQHDAQSYHPSVDRTLLTTIEREDSSTYENELSVTPSLPVKFPLTYSFSSFGSELKNGGYATEILSSKISIRPAVSIFSLTEIEIPEITSYYLRSIRRFGDSQIQPPLSSYLYASSKYEETLDSAIFDQGTVGDHLFSKKYESSPVDLKTEPSKSFSDVRDESKQEESTTESYNQPNRIGDTLPENEYLETSLSSASGEIKMEPSMDFERFLTSATLELQTKVSYESMMFSPKDYLSEHLFHPSGRIEVTTPYSGSFTKIIPWNATKQIDNSVGEFDEKDRMLSDEGVISLNETGHVLPTIGLSTVTGYFVNETTSFSVYDFVNDTEIHFPQDSDKEYSQPHRELTSSHLERSITEDKIIISPNVIIPTMHIPELSSSSIFPTSIESETLRKQTIIVFEDVLHSGILDSTSRSTIVLSSEDDLSFPKISAEQTLNQLVPPEESQWTGGLLSTPFKNIESSTSFTEVSTTEHESEFHIPEPTPVLATTIHEESSQIGEQSLQKSSSYVGSSNSFQIFAPENASGFHQYSKIDFAGQSSSIDKELSRNDPVQSEIKSSPPEHFVSFTIASGLKHSSTLFHHDPEQTPSQEDMMYSKSKDGLPDTVYSQRILRSSTALFSENVSKDYGSLEWVSSQPKITQEKTAWSGLQRPEGGLLSKIDSSLPETPVFTQGDTFHHTQTPEMTPRPLTHEEFSFTREEFSCSITSCPIFQSPDALNTPMKQSDLNEVISPTLHAEHYSGQKIHEITPHIFDSSLSVYKDVKITQSADPKSMKPVTPSHKPDPKSIESDYPHRTKGYSVTRPELSSRESHYGHRTTGIYSAIKQEPKSLETDYLHRTTEIFTERKQEPKSIDSHYSVKKPLSESIRSEQSVLMTKPMSISRVLSSFQPQPATFLPTLVIVTSVTMKTSVLMTVSAFSDAEPTDEISTLSHGIEMASVLAISSHFGSNVSRNGSSAFENSGISESVWSTTEVTPTPSLDLMLFKDNSYWILTVLEAPAKGQLSENFSQILEQRLANAYGEAFQVRSPKEGTNEPVVVKILSLKNDLLLSQLGVVYVVERGGVLVPAIVASEALNFLRHEQLREFLGLYAILKAKPYLPEESPESRPAESSSIPVVTIVCSILGFLLLLFCCFCLYCRCCRPKQADGDRTPTSSASGSLQRSLAKHGQHNRKHLFREMTHQLTTEMTSQGKHESAAPDQYVSEKEPLPPGKKLPPLPSTDPQDALDKAIKMLKIFENKESSTSPVVRTHSGEERKKRIEAEADAKMPKKSKKKKKVKESQQRSSAQARDEVGVADGLMPPPLSVAKEDGQAAESNRTSPDSGTSSRLTTSSQASEKTSEELGSDGSNAELLPPLQDLIAKSKADSEAAAADTQVHLSKVRQRISELLDDAFALANGRKIYGSMRSKKIDPATEMFPRYASLRSQSAADCSITRHEDSPIDKRRRPISEGAQHILGALTDDGQLITRPPPKLVWDHEETEDSLTQHSEVTEAHNRHVNFFPFQQQISAAASSSTALPSHRTASSSSNGDQFREAEMHSSKIHPAAEQYDESTLRGEEGEPVADLIRAIKDELQKFRGSSNNESHA